MTAVSMRHRKGDDIRHIEDGGTKTGSDCSDANTHQKLKEERNGIYPRAFAGSTTLPTP